MAVAITCRNALRIPEKISGSALGISTRQSTCAAAHAHPARGVAHRRIHASMPA